MLVVLVAAGIVVLNLPDHGPEPKELVRDYLNAARSGNVDRALELAGRHPAGEVARYLTADALDGDWTVGEVTSSGGGGDVRVTATITSPDGRSTTGDFTVLKGHHGRWHLANPFVRIGFGPSPLRYIDLNGVVSTLDTPDPAQQYLLLPGVYRLFPTDSKAVTMDPVELLLLPGAPAAEPLGANGIVDLPDPVPTAEGLASAQLAVNAFVDACAKATKLRVANCPFSTINLGDDAGYEYMWDEKNVKWTVESYPAITLADGGATFTVTDAKPGKVKLTAIGIEEKWNGDDFVPYADRKIAVTCQIQARWLTLTLGSDGTWVVRHNADPAARTDPATFQPGRVLDTCLG